jgi:hypothetical protein
MMNSGNATYSAKQFEKTPARYARPIIEHENPGPEPRCTAV